MITTLRFFAYAKQGSTSKLSPRQVRRLRRKAAFEVQTPFHTAGLTDEQRDRLAVHRGFATDVATSTTAIHLQEAIATMLTGLRESTAQILSDPAAQQRLINSIREVGDA